jgi:hypothetical protein
MGLTSTRSEISAFQMGPKTLRPQCRSEASLVCTGAAEAKGADRIVAALAKANNPHTALVHIRAQTGVPIDGAKSFLQTGASLVAAGYCLFS